MRLLSRLFGRRSDLSVFNALDGRGAVFYGTAGRSAPQEAEQLATVVACVSAISSGLASLPARVYRAEQDGRREVSDHWLARLVRNPGPHNTWYSLMAFWLSQTVLWGNGLLEVQYDGRGVPTALLPIPWDGVAVVRLPSGAVAFDVADGQGGRRRILEGDALWLRERSSDGLVGVSKLERCPEVLTAARSQQQFAISVFESGATPSAVMTLPPGVSAEGVRRAEAFFTAKHTGAKNMRRVLFMDPQSTFTPLSSTAEDSETLASRRFGGEEIARVLGVPPAIIGDLTHGTFTNSETAGRWFGQFCLRPYAVAIEQEIARVLLPADGSIHLELDMASLQRGSELEQWQAWEIALRNGVLTPNEVRELAGWRALPVAPAGAGMG